MLRTSRSPANHPAPFEFLESLSRGRVSTACRPSYIVAVLATLGQQRLSEGAQPYLDTVRLNRSPQGEPR